MPLGPPPRPGLLGSLDRFEIVAEIGRGGMGVVYLARDPADPRPRAIKLIQPGMSRLPRALHRFLVEARHMSRLAHPHILPVLEVCERPAGPYFVMPYMERGSLCRYIHPGQPLPAGEAARIARHMAEALAFAHAKGVIHHDLKTDNILLDAEGNAYLGDFGLARSVFADSVVDIGLPQREGTAPYMAPEIARGEAGDTRSDIYSWGVILYEMLTGDLPHEGKSREAVLHAIAHHPPVAVTSRNPAAEPRLARIAAWAMAVELGERYETFGDVVADLDRAAAGAVPSGPRVPRRTSDFRRPRWVAVAAAGVALSGLGIWGAGSSRELYVVREQSFGDGLNWSHHLMGDFQADGEPDLAYLNGRDLRVYTASGELFAARSTDLPEVGDRQFCGIFDVAGNAGAELLVGWVDGPDARMTAYNQNLLPVREWRLRGHTLGNDGVNRRSGLGLSFCASLGVGGQRRLYAERSTTHDGGLRGVACYDLGRPDPVWIYPAASSPKLQHAVAMDVDADSSSELVFGSYSTGHANRTAPDGSTDEASCVTALRADGTALWRTELGGIYTESRPLAADLDGDGRHELYAWLSGAHANRAHAGLAPAGRIVRLDGRGHIIESFETGTGLMTCLPVTDATGRAVLWASDNAGVIHELGAGLYRTRSIVVEPPQYRESGLRLHAAADLDGDGETEVVATLLQPEFRGDPEPGVLARDRAIIVEHRPRVLVLGADMSVVASHQLAEAWRASPGLSVDIGTIGRDRTPTLFVRAAQLTVLRMR